MSEESVNEVLSEFVDNLYESIDDISKFERLIKGNETLSTSDIDRQPEPWTEDILIDKLIDCVPPTNLPGRPSNKRKTPDFELEISDIKIIGESKSINKVSEAISDIGDEYITNKSFSDYGIATDGIEWVFFKGETVGDIYDYEEIYRINLRTSILRIAEQKEFIDLAEETSNQSVEDFCSIFEKDNLLELLKYKAPLKSREKREQDVEIFYDLYAKVVFGKADESPSRYLIKDVEPPSDSVDSKRKDIFAVSLVNRLLFCSLLEKKSILPERFLEDLVDYYDSSLPSSLYSTVFKPLFYELFNTPKDNRRPDLRSGWATNVPYLNGGLFRYSVPNERKYDVRDDTLLMVLRKLILRYDLDIEINPKILGSVFEKTINLISDEENRQKDMGAFYTPDDVTQSISSKTIDVKAKQILLDVFSEHSRHPEKFINKNENRTLREILQDIEYGSNGWNKTSAAEMSLARLKDLNILDPACGSGHFLTTALGELHQVQLSLLRGIAGGDPDQRRAFQEKKRLALNCIYGVDLDPVAIEIAKLRVWLSIVEQGWSPEYGRLPNIEFNITWGNSLIGFPSTGDGQLQIGDAQIDKLIQKRLDYKHNDQGSKSNIEKEIARVSNSLNERYFYQNADYITERIQNITELKRSFESIDEDDPSKSLQTIKVVREDECDMDEEGAVGEIYGVDVHTVSARIYVDDWVDQRRSSGKPYSREDLFSKMRDLIEGGYEFSEFERKVNTNDQKDVDGRLFHWPIHFPEALPQNQSSCPKFDIIIGNPPYGNVLNKIEKSLVRSMRVGKFPDVAAQFFERSLHLLKENGIFGNIITPRFVYEKDADSIRDILKSKMDNVHVACFATRPDKVFASADTRTAIITGYKRDSGNESTIKTSRFIRIKEETREDDIKNIQYERANGLTLGEKIGSNGNYSLAKVGTSTARDILLKLVNASDNGVIRDWRVDEPSSHSLFRRRGLRYWMNPMLENVYASGNTPTSIHEIGVETDLKRRFLFLVLQSSLYYMYWCTYKNGRNIDWMEIDAFPVVSANTLTDNSDKIESLSDELWGPMDHMADPSSRSLFSDMGDLKPIVDRVDEFIGPLYGLTDSEVEFVKQYDSSLRSGEYNSTS